MRVMHTCSRWQANSIAGVIQQSVCSRRYEHDSNTKLERKNQQHCPKLDSVL